MLQTRGARIFLSAFCDHSIRFGWAALGNRLDGVSDTESKGRSPHRIWSLSIVGRPAGPIPIDQGTAPVLARGFCSDTKRAEDSNSKQRSYHEDKLLHERLLPASVLPYFHLARMHKPIGAWLLAWPCFWSIAMATSPGQLPDMYMFTLYGAGAVLLRGAGCTINDMWDREFDAKVERTKYRPIASGKISVAEATGFLGLQLSLGLCILLQLNDYSQVLGISSLPLVVVYPLMKRITSLPQAFLGLTINWGAIMGWASIHGSIDWYVIGPLYASGICWTLVYDTIYAHMDKSDDKVAGVRSTAIYFGSYTKPVLTGLALGMAGLQCASGVALGASPIFFIGVSAGMAHVLWQIYNVDLDSADSCLQQFNSNTAMGALPMAGIVVDRLFST